MSLPCGAVSLEKIQEQGLQRLNVKEDNVHMSIQILLQLALHLQHEVSEALDELVLNTLQN